MMTERPILFSGEMVRAVLGGRKTQTRRVMRLPRWSTGNWADFELDDQGKPLTVCGDTGCLAEIASPYGTPGDSLWVRETHTWITLAASDPWRLRAAADGCLKHHPDGYDVAMIYRADGDEISGDWRPSIFMPRWGSRISLDVVSIRVERLRDITTADAMAEGCPVEYRPENCNGMSHAVHGWFEYLWDSINLKRGYGWDVNPWVWVVEFAAATRSAADASGAILDRP